MFLPAGGRLQVSIVAPSWRPSRSRQVCCLVWFPDCRLGTATNANGALPARSAVRTPSLFCAPSSLWSEADACRLDRVRNSCLVNRIRFGHRVVLHVSTAPHARCFHHFIGDAALGHRRLVVQSGIGSGRHIQLANRIALSHRTARKIELAPNYVAVNTPCAVSSLHVAHQGGKSTLAPHQNCLSSKISQNEKSMSAL